MGWNLHYRPVDSADDGFLLTLYASTRAPERVLSGWDAPTWDAFVRMQFKAQCTHYLAHWPASEHSVIQTLHDGALHDVGRLWLDRRPGVVHVLDIALLPAWCGRGLGTACLTGLQKQVPAQAQAQAQALSIQVEHGNPARRLYERLGFVPVGEPQGIHQLMRWLPNVQIDPDAQASFPMEALSEQT